MYLGLHSSICYKISNLSCLVETYFNYKLKSMYSVLTAYLKQKHIFGDIGHFWAHPKFHFFKYN